MCIGIEGVSASPAMPGHAVVLRIKPPMCITAADADFTIDVLDRALTAAAH